MSDQNWIISNNIPISCNINPFNTYDSAAESQHTPSTVLVTPLRSHKRILPSTKYIRLMIKTYLIFILPIQVLSSMGIPKASVSIILFTRNDFIDITNEQNVIELRL